MPVATRRRYRGAFETEARRLVSESGRPVARIARELGISDNLLYRWVGGQRHAQAQGMTSATLREERKDLVTLKRDNLLSREERNFYEVQRRASRERPMRYRAA